MWKTIWWAGAGTCFALVGLCTDVRGQSTVDLGAPIWTASGEYSDIRAVRELSDGRVLFVDWLEERVLVADAEGRTRDLYRVGRGPREFRLPAGLLALPADTTVLIDQGNGRLTLLDPELRMVGDLGGPPSMRYRPTPRAIDAEGRLYFTLPGWVTGRDPGSTDSVSVWRWDRTAEAPRELARVKGSTPRSDAGQPRMTPGIPFVMFAAQDGWTVDSAGNVLLVRSADYRVDRVAPDGEPTRGPSAPGTGRPVTDEDRHEMVRAFVESSPIGGRGEGLQAPPAVSDDEVAEMVRTNEFAETVPHFAANQVFAAPDGDLWVGHWSTTGDAVPAYDVFAADGRLSMRVHPGEGRRVVGFGSGRVYVVFTDGYGLQRLEAYRLP